jgi:hypothetical protein
MASTTTAPLTADDYALRAGFEAQNLPDGAFPHRAHVRLTWGYLLEEPPPAVVERLLSGLRAFAAARGAHQKFHYTMTRVWVQLISGAIARHPGLDFEALIERCAWLLDQQAPLRYYSREQLFSPAAREGWLPPDREPLP